MRLKILRVRFKNLFSFGNSWTELEFEDGKITLIVGKNGDGKSTFYEALFFGLYGKPFRKINKDGLVNTTNGKQTLVEVELVADDKQVKVVRGIRPNTFEIYINGVLKNQEASAWDYQGWFEETILRMDERTFRQLVILGSSSFVPFMALKTWERRQVVEDVLSLGIYSQMLQVVKKRTAEVQQIKEDTARAIDHQKIEIRAATKALDDLKKLMEVSASGYYLKREECVVQIERKQNEIKTLTEENPDIGVGIEVMSRLEQIESTFNRSKMIYDSLSNVIEKLNSEELFFSQNDTCPTCHQTIGEEFRADAIEKVRSKIDERIEAKSKLEETSANLHSQLLELRNRIGVIRSVEEKIRSAHTWISNLKKEIKFLDSKIKEIENANTDQVSVNQREIDEANKKINSFIKSIESQLQLLDDLSDLDSFLRDGGVKAKIIAEHLPIINALIKKYLEILDFPVQMTFADDFSEVIRSRFKEEFSYGNLSNGEKMRIDLALLFTWREITRISNSASCNLLILDEIGDSSLDADGFEAFMKILKADRDNQSVVVISHKPYGVSNQVDRIIEISKADGFSKIVKCLDNDPEEMF